MRGGLLLSYVVPLRRWRSVDPDPLTGYLGWLATRAEVIVVDGSAPEIFAVHRGAWGNLVAHVAVDPGSRSANGKVGGVLTGMRVASHEKVVLADDDVRWDDAGLIQLSAALDDHDLVRPQNFFEPLPWHARWDTARILLNRALGNDFPGTLGVRRSMIVGLGGYDGDSLFENLELLRTVEAADGRVANCPWLYVRRVPPSVAQFARQRVRQAYDSFAQPCRLAMELSIIPAIALVSAVGRSKLVVCAMTAVLTAEAGRRRAGGSVVFPVTCSLLAPCWMAERGVCSWVAVWLRFTRGGFPYGGLTLRKAASSMRTLRASRARPVTLGGELAAGGDRASADPAPDIR